MNFHPLIKLDIMVVVAVIIPKANLHEEDEVGTLRSVEEVTVEEISQSMPTKDSLYL